MSSAALARKRRANLTSEGGNQSTIGMAEPSSQEGKPRVNMTIPQVLSVFEKRIMDIEKMIITQPQSESNTKVSDGMKQVIDEYEERFEMLLTQINQMKEMISGLQMYTMEVNKILLERSGILTQSELNQLSPPSPVEETIEPTFTDNITDTTTIVEDNIISSIPEETEDE